MPCYRRCKDLEHVGEETIIENDGEDGGWVETHSTNEIENKVCDMTLDENKNDDEISGDMENDPSENKCKKRPLICCY